MSKTIEYIKEVKAELSLVHWPTRHQTIMATIAVMAISAGVSYYLGFFDYVFGQGLGWLIIR